MSESSDPLAALRRDLALLAPPAGARGGVFALGCAAVDDALGGGLARGRVHELFAREAEDAASAGGMAAMLAIRTMRGRIGAESGAGTGARVDAGTGEGEAPVLWLRLGQDARRGSALYAPGLAELGADPAAFLCAMAPDPLALLRAAADAARCSGLAAVIVEAWGRLPALDLTASRRLTLAAEQSGVPLLVLRIDAVPVPSAADTRWSVAAAPSVALEANAPGPAMLDLELLRQRAGPAGMRWRLEWDRDRHAFREPALPGAVVPLPAGRPAAAIDAPGRRLRA